MSPITLPHTIRHYSGGGCAFIPLVLLGPPLGGGLATLLRSHAGLSTPVAWTAEEARRRAPP